MSQHRNKNHSSSKLVVCLNLVSFWKKRKKEKYKKNHIYICTIHEGRPISKDREKHPGDEADLTWKTPPPRSINAFLQRFDRSAQLKRKSVSNNF